MQDFGCEGNCRKQNRTEKKKQGTREYGTRLNVSIYVHKIKITHNIFCHLGKILHDMDKIRHIFKNSL